MRITFVCQHLAEPEGAAPARALYALCTGLIEEGHEVHILDDFSTGQKSNLNRKAELHEVDITDPRGRQPLRGGVRGRALPS